MSESPTLARFWCDVCHENTVDQVPHPCDDHEDWPSCCDTPLWLMELLSPTSVTQ